MNKYSITFAIILTALLTFSPFCDAQSLRESNKERVQSAIETFMYDGALNQSGAKQTQSEIPKPKTISEFAEILGCTPERAIEILKRLPDEETTTTINGVKINVEAVRVAASQVKEKAPFQKVDLGLSVLWASCNIGASIPRQYGDYLAWGAILPPDLFNRESFGVWQYYIWNDPQGEFKKYDKTDNKTRLELVDDVAQYKYGGGWRMPTNDEFRELINKCTWSWQEDDIISGYKVTGPNGNSIFLPAGGYNPSNHIMQKNETGMYWSAEIGSARYLGMTNAEIDYRRGCYLIFFRGGSINVSSGDRCNGLLIRAVWDEALLAGSSTQNSQDSKLESLTHQQTDHNSLERFSKKDQESIKAIAKELEIDQETAVTVFLYLQAGQPVTMNGKTLSPDFIKGKDNQQEQKIETIPFQMVEQKPSFNGGDINVFVRWIKEQISDKPKEGRLVLAMKVNHNGSIAGVRVIRGLDPNIDKEVVRIASSSPKWAPGRQNGNPVNVEYSYVPVVFSEMQVAKNEASNKRTTQSSTQQASTSMKTAPAEATDNAQESAWLVGTWTVNTREFGRISLIISGNGQTGRLNFDGEKGSYEVKGSELLCHIDGDPKDLITVFQIHSGHRIYFGEGYYFNKVK